MNQRFFQQVSTWTLCGITALSILWRGGKSLDIVWLTAGMSVLLTIISLLSGMPRRRYSTIFVSLVFTFLILSLLSFAFSETEHHGFDEVVQLVSYSLLLYYVLPSLDTNKTLNLVSKTIAVGFLLSCFIGCGIYILQPISRFSGTFFDARFHTDYWPNAWAEFALLAWPFVVYYVLRNTSKLTSSTLRWLIIGLIFGCLFLSYSRGALLCLLAQMMLGLGHYVYQNITNKTLRLKKTSTILFAKKICTVLIASVITFAGINHLRSQFFPIESLTAKATFQASEGKSSVNERRDFWKQALVLAMQKPMLGYGPYSFRFTQTPYATSVLATSDHPHNVFLKIAAERGIPTMIIFSLLLVTIGCSLLRQSFNAVKSDSSILTLQTCIFVGLTGVLLHNIIDFNLQFVGIALPSWILVAFSIPQTPEQKQQILTRVSGLVVTTAFLLFIGIQASAFILGSRARQAEMRGDTNQAKTLYQSITHDYFRRDNQLSLSKLFMRLNQITEAKAELQTYSSQNKHDVRSLLLLGEISLKEGSTTNAVRLAKEAYNKAKYTDPSVLHRYLSLLEPQELSNRRKEFELLLNDYALAIEENTHFISLGSGVEEIIKAAEVFVDRYPEDAEVYRNLADHLRVKARDDRAKYTSRGRGVLW